MTDTNHVTMSSEPDPASWTIGIHNTVIEGVINDPSGWDNGDAVVDQAIGLRARVLNWHDTHSPDERRQLSAASDPEIMELFGRTLHLIHELGFVTMWSRDRLLVARTFDGITTGYQAWEQREETT